MASNGKMKIGGDSPESGMVGQQARTEFRGKWGRFVPIATGCFWPILLKKSAMVSTVEKYALEIEIFTFGRGLRTQISRSSVQKRRFNQSMTRLFGRTDFFNRIGRFLPVA